jgi:hypothetical protein
MTTFSKLVDEYNNLVEKRNEIICEIKKGPSDCIRLLLEDKLKELNTSLKVYEEGKFYTKEEYDRATAPTGWENVDMKNPANW